MASSFTRTTIIEVGLMTQCRIAFARLWHDGGTRQMDQARFTVRVFADILNMPVPTLMRLIEATSNGWTRLTAENRTMKEWERVVGAGNAFADAGGMLFLVGRRAEAEKFCEWGAQLWDVARWFLEDAEGPGVRHGPYLEGEWLEEEEEADEPYVREDWVEEEDGAH